jgi:Protein of unknown function (DUF2934)
MMTSKRKDGRGTSRPPKAPTGERAQGASATTRERKPRAEASATPVAPHFHEDRRALIAEAAYLIAHSRGFAPGHELEDWLSAEEEVDQRLSGEGRVF